MNDFQERWRRNNRYNLPGRFVAACVYTVKRLTIAAVVAAFLIYIDDVAGFEIVGLIRKALNPFFPFQ